MTEYLKEISEQLKIANQLKCLELLVTVSKNKKSIDNTSIEFFKHIANKLGVNLEFVG